MGLNKYIKQYPKQTSNVATDAYLFQRGGNYYYIEQSDLLADLALYIPLTGSSVITGDLKYTKGSAANFGTADNFGLNIITNNTTKVTVTSAGLVGINKTVPTTQFEVVSDVAVASTYGSIAHLISSVTGAAAQADIGIGFGSQNFLRIGQVGSVATNWNTDYRETSFFTIGSVSGATNKGFVFICETGLSGGFAVNVDDNSKSLGNSSTAFYVNNTNSRTGIYTRTPAYRLDVYGDVGITSTGGGGYLYIVAQSSAPTAPSATGLNIYSDANGDLAFTKKNGSDTYNRIIASTLTANRTFTLSDSDQTLAAQTGIYFGRYASKYYGVPKDKTINGASTGWTANRVHAMPFPLGNMNTISSIRMEVTTAVAASTIEVGVYADDGTGYPGTLLGSGQLDSSGTGFKTPASFTTLTNLLQYKQVWLAYKVSSNSIGLRYYNGQMPLIPRGIGTDDGSIYYYAGAAGALPGTFAGGATMGLPTTYGGAVIEVML